MIRTISLLILLFCSLSMVFAQKKKESKKKKKSAIEQVAPANNQIDYQRLQAPLPPLNVLLENGHFFNEQSLQPGKSFVLMLFNPTCGHCEETAKEFAKNMGIFKTAQLLLVYSKQIPNEYAQSFITNYATHGTTKLMVGVDSSGLINNLFRYQNLPQLNIYNSERKLIKVFNGGVALDSLKNYLQ